MKSKYAIKKPFYKQAFPMTIFILLIVYVISFLTPFLWALLTSFNTHQVYLLNFRINPNTDTFGDILCKIFYVPRDTTIALSGKVIEGFTFDNYTWAIENFKVELNDGSYAEFPRLLLNSLLYSVINNTNFLNQVNESNRE